MPLAALLLALLLAVGCLPERRTSPRLDGPAPEAGTQAFSAPAALPQAKAAVAEYYDSGRQARETAAVARQAREWLAASLARPGDRRPAVVFDLDDTLVSSYPWRKSLDFAEPAALARTLHLPPALLSPPLPAVEPVRDLFAFARDNGALVFVVSERPEADREAVIDTLYKAGYMGWAEIYLTPPGEGGAPVAEVKCKIRAFIESRGARILAAVGDHPEDLAGGHAERTFLLPNPMY